MPEQRGRATKSSPAVAGCWESQLVAKTWRRRVRWHIKPWKKFNSTARSLDAILAPGHFANRVGIYCLLLIQPDENDFEKRVSRHFGVGGGRGTRRSCRSHE